MEMFELNKLYCDLHLKLSLGMRLLKPENIAPMRMNELKNDVPPKGWPPYWPTGRLADNQKMRNLTDNLSKMSNEAYSKAVIGQFKTLSQADKYIAVFSSTSVTKVYPWSDRILWTFIHTDPY